MLDNQYDILTVEEIAYKAGYSRRTFYRYFSSKNELLKYGLSQIIDEYTLALTKEVNLSVENIANIFFNFWFTHVDLFYSLNESDLLFELLNIMNIKIPQIHKSLKDRIPEYGKQEEVNYVLYYSIGGFWNLLVQWMANGREETPEQFRLVLKHVIDSIQIKDKEYDKNKVL